VSASLHRKEIVDMSRYFVILQVALALFLSMQVPAQADPAAEAGDDCETFSDVDFEGHFSEALGERLYHRGFYPEAMTAWHCAFLEEADSGAAFRMAVEYIDAKVVEHDAGRALELLTASAVRGEARAQFELGAIYEDGTVVDADSVRAMLWYMAAAQQGHAAAEYSLGIFHEKGLAAGSDKLLAYSYYELADSHGFPLVAKEAKERLAVEMSERDMEIALATVRRLDKSRSDNPPLR